MAMHSSGRMSSHRTAYKPGCGVKVGRRQNPGKPLRTTELPEPPVLIERADWWKPGTTARSEEIRPTLNGQPVAGCFEANTTEGWVKIAADGLPQIKYGYVELVPVPPACR